MSDFKPDIWRLQAQSDTNGLIQALTNSDITIRKKAAAALRALGSTEAIPTLRTTLETEQDPETRAHLLAALEGLEEEEQRLQLVIDDEELPEETAIIDTELHRMIRQLDSVDEDEVISAAGKLGELGDKQAVEPLIVVFEDKSKSTRVRLAVAKALLHLESALVEIALLGALQKPDWRVRRNGAAILGQMKADWAVVPLTHALRDNNDKVRRTAYAALRYINTSEAREALKAVKKALRKSTAKLKTKPEDDKSVKAPAETHDLPADDSISSEQTADEPDEIAISEIENIPDPKSEIVEVNKSDDENTDSDEDKISWPKRETEVEVNIAPTRPLDPARLEEARARFEKKQQEDKEDDE